MGADTLLAIAAIITALFTGLAGLLKANQGSKDIKKLEAEVKVLRDQNATIQAENVKLRQENKDLREANEVLAGINEEYRNRLLSELKGRR